MNRCCFPLETERAVFFFLYKLLSMGSSVTATAGPRGGGERKMISVGSSVTIKGGRIGLGGGGEEISI